ncbi:MAG: hypothetical protein Q9219_002511 [cf. Caloplaca sp. 3 TL-2023]
MASPGELPTERARDEWLEEHMDPRRVATQMERIAESEEAMEQAGYQNIQDWAERLEDEPRRLALLEERKRRGKEELAVLKDQIELRREEYEEARVMDMQLAEYTRAWKVKEESEELTRSEQAIVTLMQQQPSLAVFIGDPRINEAVDKALDELKAEAAANKKRLFAFEEKFYQRVKTEVQDDLQRKFDRAVEHIQTLVIEADRRTSEAKQQALERERKLQDTAATNEENQKLQRDLNEREARYQDLQNSMDRVERDCKELQDRVTKLDSKNKDTEQALQDQVSSTSHLLKVFVGSPVVPSLFRGMATCETKSLGFYDHASNNPFDRVNTLPRMLFVPGIPSVGPKLHAINFWLAAHDDRPCFGDTQALFNVRQLSTEMAVAYPWVLEALEREVQSIPGWGNGKLGFQRILTVLHGIAYLNLLAHAMQISLEDIERLCNGFQERLTGSDAFGSEPFILTVLGKVADAVHGQPLTSWIEEAAVSEEDAARRVDSSNSDLGAQRCIIADTSGKIFLLLDGITADESLFIFHSDEMERVLLAGTGTIELELVDGFVADNVDRRLLLQQVFVLRIKAAQWVSRYFLDKLPVY